jgi:hypothetical protein
MELIRLELLATFPAGLACDMKRGEDGDLGLGLLIFACVVMFVRGPSVGWVSCTPRTHGGRLQ